MFDARPCKKQQRHDNQSHHHDRAQIGLQEDQSTEQSEDDQRRQQAAGELRQLVLLLAHIGRDINHHHKFGQLGGLNVDRPHMQPSSRPLGRTAERGNENQHQQHRRHQQQWDRELPPEGVVDLRHKMHHEQAGAQPCQLTFEEIPRIVKAAPRHYGARAEHHYDSHQGKDERDRQERRVHRHAFGRPLGRGRPGQTECPERVLCHRSAVVPPSFCRFHAGSACTRPLNCRPRS